MEIHRFLRDRWRDLPPDSPAALTLHACRARAASELGWFNQAEVDD